MWQNQAAPCFSHVSTDVLTQSQSALGVNVSVHLGPRAHLLHVELAHELEVQIAHVLPHARRRRLRRRLLPLHHRRHVAEPGRSLALSRRDLQAPNACSSEIGEAATSARTLHNNSPYKKMVSQVVSESTGSISSHRTQHRRAASMM